MSGDRVGTDRPDAVTVDRRFLDRAVRLGWRGWGRVHPNPLVGCVLVKAGEIVGEGWHAEYGGPHAEVIALARAGEEARGSTAYVSLEPCRHAGKTPACTGALLRGGVSRVVFGALDPGREAGGGAEELRAAGIDVTGPLLSEREARWENPVFFHRSPERPWLALKLALSLDGRISAGGEARTMLLGEGALEEVHWLRAGFDAILVGTRTALLDDPLLTVRGALQPRVPPRRVLIDALGRIDPGARVLHTIGGEVWIVTTPGSPDPWRERMREAGVRLLEVPAGPKGGVALAAAVEALSGEGVRSVLCEGGGILGTALLGEGLVDRLHLILTPRFLGPDGAPAFPDPSRGPDAAPSGSRAEIPGGVPGAPTGDEAWRSWVPGEEPRLFGRDVWISLEPEPR